MNEINPNTAEQKRQLKKWGQRLLVVGGLFVAVGLGSFFSSMGTFEPPRYFWCTFIGFPMLWFGGMLFLLAHLGTIKRFMAGEAAPVAKDTINYMGKNTKEGVSDFAEALFDGMHQAQTGHLSVADRIHRLDDLLKQGLITQEEYQQQKTRILDEL